ncbi:MAG: ChbG/HpnK family deacetylase [Anaerolineae bacterium]|nr:ChbG/HpnK family deacetylase [Anaerolineae bacterium]
MNVIINGDDFGMRPAINQAVFEAHQAGRLASTSLLVDGAAVGEAVALAQQCPQLGIGLHLNLDPYLGYDVDGYYGRTLSNVNPARLHDAINQLDAVEREIDRQFERFFALGLVMSHVDSHHNAHLLPEIFAAVVRVAGRYNIRAMRFYPSFYEQDRDLYHRHKHILAEKDFRVVDHFRDFSGPQAVAYLNEGVTELMVHLDKPGWGGETWCEAQFERLMSPAVEEQLRGQQARIVSYHVLWE